MGSGKPTLILSLEHAKDEAVDWLFACALEPPRSVQIQMLVEKADDDFAQAAPHFELKCCPKKRGICGTAGREHYVLDGPGVTKQAQTYSHSLAGALARTFREAWTVNHFSVVDSAFRR